MVKFFLGKCSKTISSTCRHIDFEDVYVVMIDDSSRQGAILPYMLWAMCHDPIIDGLCFQCENKWTGYKCLEWRACLWNPRLSFVGTLPAIISSLTSLSLIHMAAKVNMINFTATAKWSHWTVNTEHSIIISTVQTVHTQLLSSKVGVS